MQTIMADNTADENKVIQSSSRDLINRGRKNPTPLGTAIFVGLRSLDPFLQYQILKHGLGTSIITRLGGTLLPIDVPTATGLYPIDALGLSPYRLILLAMAAGSSIKQIYWLVGTSQEEFPPGPAVAVSVYNTLFNSIASLLFTCAATSGSTFGYGKFPQLPLIIGAVFYTVGIFTEAISETQRAAFKADPKNKGKAHTTGLFGLARHINYGGYSLWRGGYMMAASGFVGGAIAGTFLALDFSLRAIPVLTEYCQKRYGAQWQEYEKKVPYKLFPYIY